MKSQEKILGTDDAWDTGALGAAEQFAAPLSAQDVATDQGLINEALSLQLISIRLEKSLIEDFKALATLHGLGYQTLMRQALKRFAEIEKKRLLQDVAAKVAAKVEWSKSPKRSSGKAKKDE